MDQDIRHWKEHDKDLCMLCGAHGPGKHSLFLNCFCAIEEVVPEAINLREQVNMVSS